MDDIEVEAVDSLADPGTPDPEYVLYGGKGGVGKTTMAAATALASARDGTPTLVVSTDPAHSLSDSLGTPVPADPAPVHDEVPLYGAEIDPDAALEEAALFGAGGGLQAGGLGDLLGADEDAPLSVPGADEAAAMQQLLRFMDDDRFERVVVDTAPTGHALRLLELPEAMDSMLGTLLQFRERLGGMLGGVNPFGDDDEDPTPDLAETREQVERLRGVLQDPARTDFRIVMVPEEMSVRESRRLREELRAGGVPVGTVVVNRLLQDPAEVVGDGVDAAAPDHEDCAFCARRWEVQRSALRDAMQVFEGQAIRRVPLLAEEVRGERLLRVVGACLAN